MEFFNILQKECCQIDLKANTKEDVINELAQLACKNDLLGSDKVDMVATALKKREVQGSTGFGEELAIPHARIENLKDFVLAIGIHNAGVDFDSLDKKKVKMFFVILGPAEKVNEHLKILAAVSRAVSTPNFKKEILAAKTHTGAFETFLRNTDELGESKKEHPKMKLMIMILFLEDLLYDILEFFIQRGIEGATIIDSFGMGEYISKVPLFATFIGFMQEKKNHSKTIMAMIPENSEKDLVQGIEVITGGDLEKRQGAMIMTVDINFYKGDMTML